jgi:thiosulfate/3-mercaptopyruvate sulfurtransferase
MRTFTQLPWSWGSVAVVLLLLLAWTGHAAAQTASAGYANTALLVSAPQVMKHLRNSDWRMVDVRSPEQYAAAHIPGAVNLPISAMQRTLNGTPAMLAPLAIVTQALGDRGIARDSQVVIYDDIGGLLATRLFWVLDYLGHPRVSVLQGGFAMWQQEGRPVSQQVTPLQVVPYQATPEAAKLADLSWVQAHLQNPDTVLLDARSAAEFTGQKAGRQIGRPGHIPGAVNVDWVRNLTATAPHQFKAGAELAALYRDAGVTPEKEIVVYCRTGMRASHTYFILRFLGYPRVRTYDGSYVEWAADATLPIAP